VRRIIFTFALSCLTAALASNAVASTTKHRPAHPARRHHPAAATAQAPSRIACTVLGCQPIPASCKSGSRQNARRIADRLRCHRLPARRLAAALKGERGNCALTDHIIGGLSYNYYEFPTVTLGGGINPVTITSHQSVNAIVATASYKF